MNSDLDKVEKLIKLYDLHDCQLATSDACVCNEIVDALSKFGVRVDRFTEYPEGVN